MRKLGLSLLLMGVAMATPVASAAPMSSPANPPTFHANCKIEGSAIGIHISCTSIDLASPATVSVDMPRTSPSYPAYSKAIGTTRVCFAGFVNEGGTQQPQLTC